MGQRHCGLLHPQDYQGGDHDRWPCSCLLTLGRDQKAVCSFAHLQEPPRCCNGRLVYRPRRGHASKVLDNEYAQWQACSGCKRGDRHADHQADRGSRATERVPVRPHGCAVEHRGWPLRVGAILISSCPKTITRS